jgi:outer membrane protein OmpA-like peptidoglycan-associated protein
MSHTPVRTPRRWRRGVAATLAVLAAGFAVQVETLPASAAPTASVTSTTTTEADSASGAQTTLSGLSVQDPSPSQRITVELATTRGTLTMPTQAGLTLGYGNHWSGDPSISFTGVMDDINTALAAVRLVGDGTFGSATVSVTTFPEDSTVVYAAPNQHFYEYVPASGISWDQARTSATARSYRGMAGYLATMPTQPLNDFVTNRIQGATNVWFGAYVLSSAPPAGVGRQWAWTDGPLADRVFTECTSASGSCVVVNGGPFTSWAAGEPNNSGGTESAAVTNWNSSQGKWNDLNASSTISSISGYVVEYGDRETSTTVPFTGVLRASSTVIMATVPSTPATPVITVGDAQITAAFTAPSANGSALTKYVVTATPSGGGSPVSAECPAPATSCTVTGLTNGTIYDVTVKAHNARGASLASPSAAGKPVTVPGAPTAVSVARGDGQVSVSFTAPASDGGSTITGYRVTRLPGGVQTSCPGSPCAITGLTNGTAYTFTVEAINAVGTSAAGSSGSSVTPAGAPGGPRNGAATGRPGSARVTFDPPTSDNGSPVTGYQLTLTPSGGGTPVVVSCSASPCDVTGLADGTTYTVTVAARNTAGTGSPVAAGSVTPVAAPGAPTALQTVSRDAAALLSFVPPVADGGRPITSYDVSTDGGTTWGTLTTTPVAGGGGRLEGVVTGLTNGRTHDLRIRAVNSVGAGTASVTSTVSPAGRPSAPRDVTVALDGLAATVSWAEPASDGGAPVVAYTVTSEPAGLGCTAVAPARSCTVTGLDLGARYRFRVTADNADASRSGTGVSGDAPSHSTTTTAAPAAPSEVTGTPGDRVLSIQWKPTNPGLSAISRYEISVEGTAWQPVTTVARDGGRLAATVAGVLNGRSHDVRVRAVNASGPGAEARTRIDEPAWFADPLTKAQRADLVRIPRDPETYRGPVRRTTAFARASDGTPAMDIRTLKGRQMQVGQAATITDSKMFVFDTTILTPYGRNKLEAMVDSLTYVDAVRCEGHADYGGREARAALLAEQRAAVTCARLEEFGADIETTSRGFSNRAPVVVGGRGHRDRTLNRRVVVVVTRG